MGASDFQCAKRFPVQMIVLALVILFALLAPAGEARPGELDSSFGDDGSVLGPRGGPIGIEAMERLPDGRLITLTPAGPQDSELALARLAPDGSVDQSFGGGRPIATGVAPSGRALLAVRPDGRIIVGGIRVVRNPDPYYTGAARFFVKRFLPDGTPDPSFVGGETGFPADGGADPRVEAYLTALEPLPDGRLLLAGRVESSETPFQTSPDSELLAMARLDPSGELDESFGERGMLLIRESSRAYLRPHALLVRRGGEIVLAGERRERFPLGYGGLVTRPMLVQFEAGGEVDRGFGQAGRVLLRNPDDEGPFVRLVAGPRGSLRVAQREFSSPRFVVWAFARSGQRDRRFGVRGKGRVPLPPPSYGDWRLDTLGLIRQPDGKLLMLAWAADCGDRDCIDWIMLSRLTRNGRADAEFGDGGVATPVIRSRIGSMYGESYLSVVSLGTFLLGPDERPLLGARSYAGDREGYWNAYLLARLSDSVAPRAMHTLPRILRVDEDRTTGLTVGCREASPVCSGRIRMRVSRRTRKGRVRYEAASQLFKVSPGQSTAISARISRRAYRELLYRDRLAVHTMLRLRDANGNSNTVRRRVILSPR